MNTEAITAKTIEILEKICTRKIDSTTLSLSNDLSMNSLDMVTLLVMIEDSFYIELDESDMNPFELITIDDVIRLVCKYDPKSEKNYA